MPEPAHRTPERRRSRPWISGGLVGPVRRSRPWISGGLVGPAGLVLAGLVLAVAMAGCGKGALAAAACRPCAAALNQSTADAYATVAQRTYETEVNGSANGFAFYVIRRIPGLVDGLATRNYAAARAAVLRDALGHAVAVRVTRNHRTLFDVGSRFVIAGRVHVIHGTGGVSLGRVEVSTQNMVAFIGLIHRLTGCQVVVTGSSGQAKGSLAAAATATLPTRGPVVVAGRQYTVSSVDELAFAGEPIRISVLAPTRPAARSGQPAPTTTF